MNLLVANLQDVQPFLYKGGPGSGRHPYGQKVKDATRTHKPVTAEKLALAAAAERLVQSIVGGTGTDDNLPVDVTVGKNGIEVKSLIDNGNNKITMHPDSLARKTAWAKENKSALHTVVVDTKSGKMYYRAGVGSFRIGTMQQVSAPELRALVSGARKAGEPSLEKGSPDQERDERGRWTNGSHALAADLHGAKPVEPVKSHTLYHVTTKENAASILKTGFDLNRVKPRWQNDKAVSLTTGLKPAMKYFAQRDQEFNHAKYSVLEVKVRGRSMPADKDPGYVSSAHDYTREVVKQGYDLADRGAKYVYNPRAITHIREMSRAELPALVSVKKYSEDQPRDERGRFGSGGGAADVAAYLAHEAEFSAQVSDKAKEVAKSLGFDPKNVQIMTGVKDFVVNGQHYQAAGLAYTDQGRIEIFPEAIHDIAHLPGLVAHEVEHQVFATALNAVAADNARISADYDKSSWTTPGGAERSGNTKADGTLPEKYQSTYPAYQALAPYTGHLAGDADKTDLLAKSDGVTEYSRSYWAAYAKGEVSRISAVHETLAEMARLKIELGTLNSFSSSPTWRAFYRAVDGVAKKNA